MRSRFCTLFLVLITLVGMSCNKDRSIDPADQTEFESYLADEMDRQQIATASVTLFRGDNLLYEKYLGQADREKGIALAPNHIFLLASVSKTITATALMQLLEQGQFSLDEGINSHLPFVVKHPDSNTEITFWHLLTHTSGIIDSDVLDNEYYYGQDSPVDLGALMQDYLTPTGKYYDAKDNFAKFAPGEGYEYSNTASALMGYLVTRISGMDFNDYCKQHIFQPLGMTRTFWHLSETDTNTIVRPYIYKRGDYQPLQHYTFTDYPNGGLRSNGLDLARFYAAYANGGISNGVRLLNAATIGNMLKLQIPDLDQTQGLSFYYISEAEGLWGHEGGEEGVSTIIAFNPSDHTGAIVLTNGHDADLGDIAVSAYRFAQKL